MIYRCINIRIHGKVESARSADHSNGPIGSPTSESDGKTYQAEALPNPNIEIWTGGRYYCKNRFGCLSASVHQLWLVELQDQRLQMSWMSWKTISGDCVVVSVVS